MDNLKSKATTQKRHQRVQFDYTTISDRLTAVSLSNYSHPTGVVNWLTDPTFPLPAFAEEPKRHTFKMFVNNPPYRDRGPTVNRGRDVMEKKTNI